MTPFFWRGATSGDIGIAANFTDDYEGFVPSTVVPTAGDTVQDGDNYVNAPSEGESDADWSSTGVINILGGTYNGEVSSLASIDGGTFNGPVTGSPYIGGGIFNNTVESGYIRGGTFNGPVTVLSSGDVQVSISGGEVTFNAEVFISNNSLFSGGDPGLEDNINFSATSSVVLNNSEFYNAINFFGSVEVDVSAGPRTVGLFGGVFHDGSSLDTTHGKFTFDPSWSSPGLIFDDGCKIRFNGNWFYGKNNPGLPAEADVRSGVTYADSDKEGEMGGGVVTITVA